MANAYRILIDGAPVDAAMYGAVSALDVEESLELPGAFELIVGVDSDGSGDLTYVSDDRLKPFAALAVEIDVEGKGTECIFDGVILSHKARIGRGTAGSSLRVWGQDASWTMNLEEKVKEWADISDSEVANSIFGDYGFAVSPDNTADESPSRTESGHTLMQRASDIQFLRRLARRSGRLCRVVSGNKAGERTGVFAKPKLDAEPAVILPLNDPERSVVHALDFEWDVTSPTEVSARQALFNDPSDTGVDGGASDSGLALLAERGLADFTGRAMKAMLTATADDAGELSERSRSLLRDASCFAHCSGEVDLTALGAVLRAGMVVRVDGAGSLYSGNYFVCTVRHQIRPQAHTMSFTLKRNAVGPKGEGGGLV